MFQLEVAYPGLQRGRYISSHSDPIRKVCVCVGGGDGGAVRSASNLIPTVGAVCVGGGGGGGASDLIQKVGKDRGGRSWVTFITQTFDPTLPTALNLPANVYI